MLQSPISNESKVQYPMCYNCPFALVDYAWKDGVDGWVTGVSIWKYVGVGALLPSCVCGRGVDGVFYVCAVEVDLCAFG